jgi:FAD/FMN-containing dehydrogenase
MMDQPAIQVTENAIKIGLPTDVEALLLIELQGPPQGMDRQVEEILAICQANRASEGKVAQTEAERDKLWTARRNAFGAMAKLRPNCYVADGTVPRTKLPDVLEEVYAIADKYGLTLASMFHAGDGNLHPNIVFDARDKEETARVFKASVEMQEVCVRAGGTITGEHGVGIEKREDMLLLFDDVTLEAMARIKRAFDPNALCNPQKMFPSVVRGV